jgi:hypothetical protein
LKKSLGNAGLENTDTVLLWVKQIVLNQRLKHLKHEAKSNRKALGKVASLRLSSLCCVRNALLTVVSFIHRDIQGDAEAS